MNRILKSSKLHMYVFLFEDDAIASIESVSVHLSPLQAHSCDHSYRLHLCW